MKLKSVYESMSQVPSGYEGAFEEKDGKAVFVGGDFEFKTESEFNELHKAKKAGYDQLHELKNKFKGLDDVDSKKYKELVEELDVLRARLKDSGTDEDTIKSIVDARVARATEELNSVAESLRTENAELKSFKLNTEKKSILSKLLGEHVSSEAMVDAEYIIGSAIERQADGTYMSNGSAGFEKGLPVEKLISKAIESRPYWKKQSIAGHGNNGSIGNGGVSKRDQFKSLLEKQKTGKLSIGETKQLSTLANELKAEQQGV